MTETDRIVGLDIGGANLKAATASGIAASLPFALWRQPDQLSHRLRDLLKYFPKPQAVALTMTGELCDCFANRADGVRHIIAAVGEAIGDACVAVWTIDGRFVSSQVGCLHPKRVAAANWLALAYWAAEWLQTTSLTSNQPTALASSKLIDSDAKERSPSWSLVLDIGSTTTDLIPLVEGKPSPRGTTDLERLLEGELIYLGVRRTPVCALVPMVTWQDQEFRTAAEWFADIYDAFLVLGLVPEQPELNATADGRPATRSYAQARLARMLCAEMEELGENLLKHIARQALVNWQREWERTWNRFLRRFPGPPTTVILSGEGEWWGHDLLQRSGYAGCILRVSEQLGREISQSACAYAVARLFASSQARG